MDFFRSSSSFLIHCKSTIIFPNLAKRKTTAWRGLSNCWLYSFVSPKLLFPLTSSNSPVSISVCNIWLQSSWHKWTIAIHLYQKYFTEYLTKRFGLPPQKILFFWWSCITVPGKIEGILLTCAITRMTLKCLLNGISQLLHMERGHVTVLVVLWNN